MRHAGAFFYHYSRIVRLLRFLLVSAWLCACLYLISPVFISDVTPPQKRTLPHFETKGTNITYVMNHNKRKITVHSHQGRYLNQNEVDLKGPVTLRTQDGTTFLSRNVRLDLSQKSACGKEPIAGKGPLGTLKAQGFTIMNAGESFELYGPSTLIIDTP